MHAVAALADRLALGPIPIKLMGCGDAGGGGAVSKRLLPATFGAVVGLGRPSAEDPIAKE